MDCLFCKIIRGEVPSTKVYEDDFVYAFKDIEPQAPHHIVAVPKRHIAGANDITDENSGCIAKVFEAIPKIAETAGIAEDGYRVVNNCGINAGQTVMHIHFHVLGGRPGGKMY